MSLDPYVAHRLATVPDVSIEELLKDPLQRKRILEGSLDDRDYAPPAVTVTEEDVHGPHGPVRVRLYRPRVGVRGPGLVWAHGGGFLGGSLDMNEGDLVCRELCHRAGALVVSVDYHLADGNTTTYPIPHQDVLAAYEWVRARSRRWGADPARLALGGASAGGSLAVSATLELIDRGVAPPARLLLVYPALHDRLPESPEVLAKTRTLPRGARIQSSTMGYFFGVYRGKRTDTPYLSVDHRDLGSLPPGLLVVNEYDDLRASGEAFAARARACGAELEVYLARGMVHGHLGMTPLVPEVHATLTELAQYIAA
ncbi:alpha/beta hydrolase [Amycolatopsis balhimycina DSM 5908]|uniref:Alpha/beta hydrolase n=1 Tax=Amycolatopsis balhimycina DSM 5908 TaxID=1081091 RepID=A0A428WJI0_AMYBA|nr:alpha/beta hydrolase [Amycolatopsis balhimycina]RSM43182.1 alpha/beta hydrolase [Amycolatopsis balhimycina DSM 5908]